MSMLIRRNRNLWPATFTDNLLEDFFWPDRSRLNTSKVFSAAVDVVEGEKDFQLKVDLPGVKKEDVDISVKEGILTITAERKEDTISENSRYTRSERRYGSFSRSFSLGDNIDSDKIMANLSDGVLEVSLPRKEEVAPKSIEIN